MAITRREVAAILAASAAVAAPQSDADEETRSAHEALQDNARQLAKIDLPMSTEPACHFKP